jgi:hypothetical protein
MLASSPVKRSASFATKDVAEISARASDRVRRLSWRSLLSERLWIGRPGPANFGQSPGSDGPLIMILVAKFWE